MNLGVAMVPLTRGMWAIVDQEDYTRLSLFKWQSAKRKNGFHAQTWLITGRGKQKTILMARFITGVSDGRRVDHKNGHTLDNQKENLRPCSQQQNAANQKLAKNSTTGFKGVTRRRGAFLAQIGVNGYRKHLGMFATAEGAAVAYDAAARQAYGKFAMLNFPLQGEQPCRNH